MILITFSNILTQAVYYNDSNRNFNKLSFHVIIKFSFIQREKKFVFIIDVNTHTHTQTSIVRLCVNFTSFSSLDRHTSKNLIVWRHSHDVQCKTDFLCLCVLSVASLGLLLCFIIAFLPNLSKKSCCLYLGSSINDVNLKN